MAESDWIDIDENESVSQINPPTNQGEWVDIDTQQPRQLKPSTIQTLQEQKNLENQIQAESQKGAVQQALGNVAGIGKGLYGIIKAGLKGTGAIPELIENPSRIPATLGESSRRLGSDILGMLEHGIRNAPQTFVNVMSPENALFGPAGLILDAIQPKTLNPQELQSKVEAIPEQEAQAAEREAVRFKGAQPEVAEGIAQVAPLLVGAPEIKGLASLGTASEGIISKVPRMIRSSIKPSKGVIGSKIEKAASEEISDIFHSNPNADKIGTTPIEGFSNQVDNAYKTVGARIGELRNLSQTTLNAGDELASIMRKKAESLQKSGQPKVDIDGLLARADEVEGKMTDLNSLQDAVTSANRKPNILKPKSTAEGYADEIIAKEGGSLINKELESLGGPEGAQLRKKWSNLKLLKDNIDERVNKIINSAPAEARPVILETLASPEGIAGVFGLLHGWALPGAIVLGGKLIKNWAKNEVKNLKNSNSIIEKVYDNLRKSPPKITTSKPPVLPKEVNLNELIAQSIAPPKLPMASGPGPLPGAFPTSIPPQISEAFPVPNQENLGAIIKQLMEQEAAASAQGSQLGYF